MSRGPSRDVEAGPAGLGWFGRPHTPAAGAEGLGRPCSNPRKRGGKGTFSKPSKKAVLCQNLLCPCPEQFPVCTGMFPFPAHSRKDDGTPGTDSDIIRASLVCAHFFVYLTSQTLVLSVLPRTIDLHFLPLVATHPCVSTRLLRTVELEDQMSRDTPGLSGDGPTHLGLLSGWAPA